MVENDKKYAPIIRLRRLRQNPRLRDLVRETRLSIQDFILPLFIKEGLAQKQPITAMHGHFQLSLRELEQEIREIQTLGIPGVILFGIPKIKDAEGSAGYANDGIIPQAVRLIKSIAPELLVITDVCCCEYTDHGHCGLLIRYNNQWTVDNDATLDLLVK